MANNLSINNVINISVSQPGVGLGKYNTSNLAIFTDEAFANSFGSLGYKLYLDPTEVATDFGTGSTTYKMALKVFSQQPNILAGDGYLAVIAVTAESQKITFGATPTSGTFVFNFDGHASAAINWNDTAAQVQTKLRAVEGLEEVAVTGSITSGTGLTISYNGVEGNLALATITSNTLSNGSPVSATVSELVAGETLDAAITRTVELIEYFGILTTNVIGDAEALDAAAVVQTLNKMWFFVQFDPASVAPTTGIISQMSAAAYDQTRCLFYGSATALDALLMSAAYAGRALSTDFTGDNTTETMDLKTLVGIEADPTIDQTLLNQCNDAGADTYVSIQGVPKVQQSQANDFFDNVYNLLAFVGDLKIAGFNVLAETSTKIVQTENGVGTIKSVLRGICEQYVNNQFLAPGKWTSPNTFGNQADFYANIEQRGYYIYSAPISQQSPEDRAARKAPLIQIAIKYAGAIHKINVIVNINN